MKKSRKPRYRTKEETYMIRKWEMRRQYWWTHWGIKVKTLQEIQEIEAHREAQAAHTHRAA